MKSKILIWLLLVVIGAGLGYLVYKVMNQPDSNPTIIDADSVGQPGRGFYRLADELKLNEDQKKDFHNIEIQYQQKMLNINNQLLDINQEIINELVKEKPDTTFLYGLSTQTGLLHEQLKRATINHFIDLQSICTPQQALKLSGVLEQVCPMQRGKGNRRGLRKGMHNRNNP